MPPEIATSGPGAPPLEGDAPPLLTERQQQVLQMLALGMFYKQIALELGISVLTVRNHARNIRNKLGAASVFAAVGIAVQAGLVQAATPVMEGVEG